MVGTGFMYMAAVSMNEYFSGWTFWPLVCLIIGMVLMIVEMIAPGFGVFGITGGIVLLAAVVLQAKSFTDAMISLLFVMVVMGVAAIVIFRSFNKGRISKTSLVLDNETYSKTEEVHELMGRRGVAVNDLRPSGFADIDGKRVDVVTRGDFIKKGDSVEVVATEGSKVVVQSVASDV